MIKVGIIGGGASGLFAACLLKYLSKQTGKDVEVIVLEKTDFAGKKLLLTGHGRCNITNNKDVRILKDGYHEAGNFMYPALKAFDPKMVIDFFESEMQMSTVEQENNRIFPASEKSSTVLEKMFNYIGAETIVTSFDCKDVVLRQGQVDVISKNNETRTFDKVILAMGGKSYPHTGSDGSSYKLAQKLGHTIEPLRASLASVDVSSKDRELTSNISGVSVEADASLFYDRRKQAKTHGDVLFTHRGLSGPAIYELSREIPLDIGSRDGWIEFDFLPNCRDEEVDLSLLAKIDEKPNRKLINLTGDYVPASLSQEIIKLSTNKADVTQIYAKDTDKSLRKAISTSLKHLKFHMESAPNIDTAYCTRGGVRLSEIDKETMASKLIDGVYIIGEMLDVDGISGGYNLQAGLSEAYVVSKNILG